MAKSAKAPKYAPETEDAGPKRGREALASIASEEEGEKTSKGAPLVTDDGSAPDKKEAKNAFVLADVPLHILFANLSVIRGADGREVITLDQLRSPAFDAQNIFEVQWSLRTKDEGLRATLVKLSHEVGFGYVGAFAYRSVSSDENASSAEDDVAPSEKPEVESKDADAISTKTTKTTKKGKEEQKAPWVTYTTTGKIHASAVLNYLGSGIIKPKNVE